MSRTVKGHRAQPLILESGPSPLRQPGSVPPQSLPPSSSAAPDHHCSPLSCTASARGTQRAFHAPTTHQPQKLPCASLPPCPEAPGNVGKKLGGSGPVRFASDSGDPVWGCRGAVAGRFLVWLSVKPSRCQMWGRGVRCMHGAPPPPSPRRCAERGD